ncbi:MAG: DUF211 domain-containing protein [Thermoprotei archaeon]|nr:DUF211 domain-containing protein [Thermoprotei archaeon]
MPGKAPIRRLVLDILKPVKGPSIVDIGSEIASMDGIDGVNITVKEIDVDTMTLVVTLEGANINYEELEEKLENLGCVIHSIDQVVAGSKIVEETNIGSE